MTCPRRRRRPRPTWARSRRAARRRPSWRPSAALFTDPIALENELKRRWTSIKKIAKSTTTAAAGKGATTGSGIVKLPAALDAKQMAAMNLVFLTNEMSPMTGSLLSVYGPAAAAAAAVKVKAEPDMRRSGKKTKREDEEEEEDDDEDVVTSTEGWSWLGRGTVSSARTAPQGCRAEASHAPDLDGSAEGRTP